MEFDGQILLWIQENVRNPVLTPLITAITMLGNGGMVWVLASLLMLVPRKTRKVGVMSLLALLTSLLINNGMLKNLVARTRPYEVVDGLILLVPKQWDYSFPSGHAASSFASAWVFFRRLPKWFGLPALALAGLIGLSRLYVGVHYPTDVLFGILSGIFCGMIGLWLYEKITALQKGRTVKKEE